MNPRHVEDQLPLWVEGDLGVEEAAEVEAHLASCAACREEAEAFRESQAWLKADTAPFMVEDREELRRVVLARVQAPARGIRWGAGVATLAAASLLFFFLRSHPAEAVASLPAQTDPAPAPAPVAPPAPTVRVARHHSARPPLEPSAEPGATRIEFQTDNPRIRIIWLAQARTDEGSPHSIQEEP